MNNMNYMGYSGMVPDNRIKIQELLQTDQNETCADCGMPLSVDTAWAVLSYGIFVCDDCKLVHIQQENHCKALDQANNAETSVTGILPASIYRHWEEKDVEQMRTNGNEKVNQKLLGNVPPWLYRPLASDGIKHKEYWIKYKYGKGVGAIEEIPKTANKSFHGIQFSRPMPKGASLPCCAMLQNDKLYLTSDVKNEEIRIEDIETVLLNSKRIGKDNGVQLTYRTPVSNGTDPQNGVTYTYLQHENMETVFGWINHILYKKFHMLQEKYPSLPKDEVARMLNCFMVKESYMTADNHGLIYVSLSEARIACFRHHLDEKPLFHLPIAKALKFTGAQYLEALAQFFEMDVCKIHGYDDWNSCLERALQMDKLAYLADEVVQPVNLPETLSANKPVEPPKPEETKKITPEPAVISVAEKKPDVNNANEVTKIQEDRVSPTVPNQPEKTEGKSKKYECYPPIGPMGEMGKVARGELPPEAIKPPAPKIDPSRVQLFGMTSGLNPVSTPPMVHSSLPMSNMTSMSMAQQPTHSTSTDCYPPISGPIRDMADVFQPMPQRMPATDDMYPVIDEFKPMNNTFRAQDRRRVPFENDLPYVGRISGSNGVQSPTDLHFLQQHQQQQYTLSRSASWNPTVSGRSMEWQMKQDPYFGHSAQKSVGYRSGSQEQVIMENLQQQWTSAERKLLALIHNGYVPASNMNAAGLDANSADHAQTCISELFDLLWKERYDLALSFLRGFREVFSRSSLPEIRNQFIGVGELDTMKQIFLQQAREKFLKSSSNRVNWKHQHGEIENAWSSAPAPPTTPRELPSEFLSWGLPETTSSSMRSKVWGSTPSTPASVTPSLNTDPWSVGVSVGNIMSSTSQGIISANGSRPFNRAPSRPVSLTRSSFSETSPTEGSFDSKASSNSSASPGVVTPPASFDGVMPSPALTGIETTLKNLFLNSSSSGSTLWN